MTTIVRGQGICQGRLFYIMSPYRHGSGVAFGLVLRDLRSAADLSQERLADATGLDRTFISLLERGLRQPSLSTLLALSEALEVPLATIAARIEGEIDRQGSQEEGEERQDRRGSIPRTEELSEGTAAG